MPVYRDRLMPDEASTAYPDAFQQPQSCDGEPHDPPVKLTFTTDLAAVRAFVQGYARKAGLSETRVMDLVLAVSEIAANTVRHAKSAGTLEIWHDTDELVCQMRDKGHISDPLAGTRPPEAEALGGHGLWLVNQVCDQVEIRSGTAGTTIRLHMLLGSS
jgi:anti-sigma regulatory factor (Ser/Thr protein kinase)